MCDSCNHARTKYDFLVFIQRSYMISFGFIQGSYSEFKYGHQEIIYDPCIKSKKLNSWTVTIGGFMLLIQKSSPVYNASCPLSAFKKGVFPIIAPHEIIATIIVYLL